MDIGSLDINGNNKYLFSQCLYIGVDIGEGNNVDFVTAGHELLLPEESVDVVVSTEAFEHDEHYEKTLKNIARILKPGGLFLFTCATTGRPEHGTRRSHAWAAPFVGDYYKNIDEADVRNSIDVDALFSAHAFSTDSGACDIYFWGIKKGERRKRNNYSFTQP